MVVDRCFSSCQLPLGDIGGSFVTKLAGAKLAGAELTGSESRRSQLSSKPTCKECCTLRDRQDNGWSNIRLCTDLGHCEVEASDMYFPGPIGILEISDFGLTHYRVGNEKSTAYVLIAHAEPRMTPSKLPLTAMAENSARSASGDTR